MRFQITRLCGGKALMCASREPLSLDMVVARSVLEARGEIRSSDEMMIVSQWKDMEITLYPQGKVMFYPLDDKELAVSYATDILNEIVM